MAPQAPPAGVRVVILRYSTMLFLLFHIRSARANAGTRASIVITKGVMNAFGDHRQRRAGAQYMCRRDLGLSTFVPRARAIGHSAIRK